MQFGRVGTQQKNVCSSSNTKKKRVAHGLRKGKVLDPYLQAGRKKDEGGVFHYQ